MCRTGVRNLAVTGTVTLGSAANQGGLGGPGSQPGRLRHPARRLRRELPPVGRRGLRLLHRHPPDLRHRIPRQDRRLGRHGRRRRSCGPGRGRATASSSASPSCPGPAPWRAGAAGGYDQYFTTLAQEPRERRRSQRHLAPGMGVQRLLVPVVRPERHRRRQLRQVLAAHRHHHAGRGRPAVQVPVERERRHQHELHPGLGLPRQRLRGLRRDRHLRRLLGEPLHRRRRRGPTS